jgi:hypothetical protein
MDFISFSAQAASESVFVSGSLTDVWLSTQPDWLNFVSRWISFHLKKKWLGPMAMHQSGVEPVTTTNCWQS